MELYPREGGEGWGAGGGEGANRRAQKKTPLNSPGSLPVYHMLEVKTADL